MKKAIQREIWHCLHAVIYCCPQDPVFNISNYVVAIAWKLCNRSQMICFCRLCGRNWYRCFPLWLFYVHISTGKINFLATFIIFLLKTILLWKKSGCGHLKISFFFDTVTVIANAHLMFVTWLSSSFSLIEFMLMKYQHSIRHLVCLNGL